LHEGESVVKKTLLSTLVLALMLAGAGRASAQDDSAIVVGSIASLDKLIASVEQLASMAGAPAEFVEGIKAQTSAMLEGVDRKRPIGVTFSLEGFNNRLIGFVPVSDFETLMKSLGGEEIENGVYQLQAGTTMFAKEQGDWAFVADNPASLRRLPDDPIKLLADQHLKYDVAARVNVQNIPEGFRVLAGEFLRMGAAQVEQLPNETEEDFEVRQKATQAAIKQIVKIINETDNVQLGWKVDAAAKSTYIEGTITAVSGTDTARQMGRTKDAKSQFAGFLVPDAAIAVNLTGSLEQEDIDQMLAAFNQFRNRLLDEIDKDRNLRPEAVRLEVKALVQDVLAALEATIRSGKADAAGSLLLAPQSATVVLGGHVEGVDKIENAFKRSVQLVEADLRRELRLPPGEPVVKYDAHTHAGVRFHTARIPLADADPQARAVLGDELDVAIGFGESSIYVAIGKGNLAAAQAAIDRSAAGDGSVPSGQLVVSVLPIAQFAAAVDPNSPLSGLAEALAAFKGKDRLILRQQGVDNGVSFRIELEQGFLQALGEGAMLAAPFGGAGFEPPPLEFEGDLGDDF
jgi:hypothetical protein